MNDDAENDVERAADDAIEKFAEQIDAAGGKMEACVVLGLVSGIDPPGVIAAGNLEPDEIFDVLMLHLQAVGHAVGREVAVVNVDSPTMN